MWRRSSGVEDSTAVGDLRVRAARYRRDRLVDAYDRRRTSRCAGTSRASWLVLADWSNSRVTSPSRGISPGQRPGADITRNGHVRGLPREHPRMHDGVALSRAVTASTGITVMALALNVAGSQPSPTSYTAAKVRVPGIRPAIRQHHTRPDWILAAHSKGEFVFKAKLLSMLTDMKPVEVALGEADAGAAYLGRQNHEHPSRGRDDPRQPLALRAARCRPPNSSKHFRWQWPPRISAHPVRAGRAVYRTRSAGCTGRAGGSRAPACRACITPFGACSDRLLRSASVRALRAACTRPCWSARTG